MLTFCTFYSGVSLEKSVEATKEIGEFLDWKLIKETNGEIIFSSSFNWDTWGQKITVKYVSPHAINISVKTRFYQFGDSGSGSETIKQFIERYQEYVKSPQE